MAASSNSWLHQNLLPQHNTQQQGSPHSLFHHSEFPLHVDSTQPGPLQHMNLGHGGHGIDSHPPLHHGMHSTLHMSVELQQQQQQLQHPHPPVQVGSGTSGRAVGPTENGDTASVRKVHKADREKLRRDRLNEQFGELAGVLDPDRPKNDKATILGDSVQVVKDLRSEVKRLKCEQTSLLDESRDLQQEKTELREEKAALKTETEQLQNQLQQRLQGMLPWISMDPTAALMGAPPYPYPHPHPMPVPQPPSSAVPSSTPPASEPAPAVPTSQPPVVGPSPFLSLAPPGVYMHPYAIYGARPPERGHPYMPYPPYSASVGNHSHVERPYAQYPSPMSTMPGYMVQMQPPPPPYAVPGMTLVPPGQQPRGPPHSTYPPTSGPETASLEPQGVETSLQLQTPGGSSRPPSASEQPPSQRGEDSNKIPEVTDTQVADLELTPPGTKEAGDQAVSKPDEMNGGDAISSLTLASKSLQSRTDDAPLPSRRSESNLEESRPHGSTLEPSPSQATE
uniref:BHLH domain-containing protein n=1 Tax=Physcomitrium patens TaxID=3218 RepID=A0A7I4FTT3_PHYPA